jgi:hypothetical protein
VLTWFRIRDDLSTDPDNEQDPAMQLNENPDPATHLNEDRDPGAKLMWILDPDQTLPGEGE